MRKRIRVQEEIVGDPIGATRSEAVLYFYNWRSTLHSHRPVVARNRLCQHGKHEPCKRQAPAKHYFTREQ